MRIYIKHTVRQKALYFKKLEESHAKASLVCWSGEHMIKLTHPAPQFF